MISIFLTFFRQVERDLKDAIDRQQNLSQEFKELEGEIKQNEVL